MKKISLCYGFIIFSLLCFFISACSNQASLTSEEWESIYIQKTEESSVEDIYFDDEIDVIILAGQSNATGCSITSQLKNIIPDETYELFTTGCSNVFIIGHTDWSLHYIDSQEINLSNVKFGLGASALQFGLEIGISNEIMNKPKKTLIIKYTSPGNVIDFFLNGNEISEEFDTFIKTSLYTVTEKGCIPTIRAVCWMQGESDSFDYSKALNYENNLMILINSIRNKYGNNISFIDVPISSMNLISIYNFESLINEAKLHVSQSDSNNYLVNSDGLTKKLDDTPHYDSKSEFEIGVRIGKILQSIY